ncbi:hypothetical protein F5Y04DRAFT_81310 [Hypomontagnella monticulosa]|nr:hypothetical protein F5Y04DRAFT_81310 [Hypomontagnella monticulosa]
MSGFEIAGVVLGAFPIAIEALERYREVYKRFGLFYQIRTEFLKCSHNLKIQRVSFTSHLRRLLLPVIEDDIKLNELLSNPGGEAWKDQEITELLIHRLGEESHNLFIECINGVGEVMGMLNHELALSSPSIQDSLRKPKTPMTMSRIKESGNKANLQFQLYKLKFSNGESIRATLFKELEQYNSQLKMLLDMSDKETELVQERAYITTSLTGDTALCTFWVHAEALFKALAAAWACCCQEQHLAKLLLQHRTSKKKEFNMLFAKQLPSCWQIQKTLIKEDDDVSTQPSSASSSVVSSVAVHQPNHRTHNPTRSALRKNISSIKSMHSQSKITRIPTLSDTHSDSGKSISSLCSSLDEESDGCCGYLTEEDCRYYVYRVSQQETKRFASVTIDEILRGKVSPPPSRRQRYALSFILASSFLQLLETPWLPESWKKSDIVFISDEKNSNVFLLDQPHLNRKIITPTPPSSEEQQQQHAPLKVTSTGSRNTKTFQSLELLGIVLLELCFGQLLEEQPYRKRWPSGDDSMQKYAFDFMAARQWNDAVNEEAGPDFDEAIRWCLEGHRNTSPEHWRKEMLGHVVQPLEKCHKYLSEGRLAL